MALQQRLALVEQELAAARAAPPTAPPTSSSSAASLLEHCQSVIQSDLTPAQAGHVCRTLVRACWAAHLPVPAWLDLLSKTYVQE